MIQDILWFVNKQAQNIVDLDIFVYCHKIKAEKANKLYNTRKIFIFHNLTKQSFRAEEKSLRLNIGTEKIGNKRKKEMKIHLFFLIKSLIISWLKLKLHPKPCPRPLLLRPFCKP